MILSKKRILKISALKGFVSSGDNFLVGVFVTDEIRNKLEAIGFSRKVEKGEKILPAPMFGATSLFNAEGKYKVNKNLPMETAYRSAEWHWEEFNGPYDKVERSKIVDIPYERYPRTFISPPSVELLVASSASDKKIVVSPRMKLKAENYEIIIHTVNLLLEIFGECQFFTGNMRSIIDIPTTRLNWTILPPGKMPWTQLRDKVDPFVKKAPKGNQAVIWHRLELINEYGPDFRAVGHGGFAGYIVLGFEKQNIYTLESIYYGNATYVFGNDWEKLSKMTKAEILNDKLQKDRIIHREGWDGNIRILLDK